MRLILMLALMAGMTIAPAHANSTEGVGWIPTWKQAQTEAAVAHKPMLLVAAAPQCAGVPGIW